MGSLHSQNDSTPARSSCCYFVIWGFWATVPLTDAIHRSNPARLKTSRGERQRNDRFAPCGSCSSSRRYRRRLLYLFRCPPAQVEANQRLQPAAPKLTGSATRMSTRIDPRPSQEEEKAAAAFQQAAEAILRRAANARASADIDQPPITGKIPLPKRRPITLP